MASPDGGDFRPALLERGRNCAGATDVGPVRRRNEDAYWISGSGTFLAVADGLGGLPSGHLASSLAVAAAAEVFENATTTSGEELLRSAAREAQRRVLEAADSRLDRRGMCTTLVLAVVGGGSATVLHVGDSRAALWRAGAFVRTTFDHNEVGDLVRGGAITGEQARFHPDRHLIREVVGLREGYEAECQAWPVEAGDILLLCTDGVTEALAEHAIAGVLGAAPSAAAAAATLVALAGAAGGRDNATAVVCHVT